MKTDRRFYPETKRAIGICILLAVCAAADSSAQEPARGSKGPAAPATERELIPGAGGMTGAERDTYRRRMEMATTPDEKAQIRAEYEKAAGAKTAPAQGPSAGGLVGDPVRGASLHRACFFCHGIERYVAPATHATRTFIDSVLTASGLTDVPASKSTRLQGRVASVADLRAGVNRRNELLNPKMNPQEIEDVVAYLNATYYKFPQQ